MKKKHMKLLSVVLMLSLFLIGCSGNSDKVKNDIDPVEKVEEPEEGNQDLSNKREYDKLVYEDEHMTMTLKSIEEVDFEKYFFDAIDVEFEVVNKRDQDVTIQVENISTDGKMVNSEDYTMSTEIQANKTADAILTLGYHDTETLPSVENDMEINFKIFNWDTDLREEINVNIDL